MTSAPHPRVRNLPLRNARQSINMSQREFALALRAAGDALGTPNNCTKRLVQKWENGEHATCKPEYLSALHTLTGLTAIELGFADSKSATDGPALKPEPLGVLISFEQYNEYSALLAQRTRELLQRGHGHDSRAAQDT